MIRLSNQINGTVLQTIQYENIFLHPLHVTTSDNYIYVSDADRRPIIKLNWQGEMKGKHDCRSEPYSLTMSDDENLFVCCWSDNTIREISEDFPKEQTVVQDIKHPQAVCWSAETCTLYTSSNTLSPKEDNYIKIYKLSS